jgi:hypothetical protein
MSVINKALLLDIVLPPVAAAVATTLWWVSARSINGGLPLNPVQRIMFVYGFMFILGMCYSMAIVGVFRWPHWMWIPPTVLWTILMALLARRRYRQVLSGQQR